MTGLPPLASDEEIKIVRCACREGRAFVSRANRGQTERYLHEVWQTTFARLREAVAEHIEARRRVYQKLGDRGLLGLQANVTLYEELDIYVEMRIKGGCVVILAAHSHYGTPLPQ